MKNDHEKCGLKPVLLLHFPFILPSFLGGKRKKEITSCLTLSDPIDFHHLCK